MPLFLNMSTPGELDVIPRSFRQLEEAISRALEEFDIFLFADPINKLDFIAHIAFFLYKEYYINHADRLQYSKLCPEKSDEDRRSFNRATKKMLERKKMEEERQKRYDPRYLDLVSEKTEKGYINAYHLINIDGMAIKSYNRNVARIPLVPMLMDGRFADSKASSWKTIYEV